MQTAFAQQSPEDCGPNQVFQLGFCQDINAQVIVAWDQANYKICDTGIVTVNDENLNVESGFIDLGFVRITSDSDPVGVEILIVESSVNSAVFTGDLQLCGELNVSVGDKVYATYGNVGDAADIVSSYSTTPTITVSTDKITYDHDSTIFVSGKVTNPQSNIAVGITVFSPNNLIVTLDQLSPDSFGNFNTAFRTGGNVWADDGTYTIQVQYGTASNKALVELVGGDSTTQPPITVSTDRYSYKDGDTIRISGKVSDILSGYLVTMQVLSPQGLLVAITQMDVSYSGSFSTELTAGGSLWEDSGTYTIQVLYGTAARTAETNFHFEGSTTGGGGIITLDNVPPKILQPKDIVVDAEDGTGMRVYYDVLAIDDVDQIVKPSCTPSSGSFFSIGNTKVVCSAFDSAGNAAQQKTFLVTVNPPALSIPVWIKEVAAFWCDDKIDDSSFIEGIQYLINNNIIIITGTTTVGSGGQEIPSWIKNNACWWSQGLISDSDFAQGLQYLVKEGIIRV